VKNKSTIGMSAKKLGMKEVELAYARTKNVLVNILFLDKLSLRTSIKKECKQ
jgi:hypothetical protein